MLTHVQPRSGGLAVLIAIPEVAKATARLTGNGATMSAVCLRMRAPLHRKTFRRP
jgi:hypothetical protein